MTGNSLRRSPLGPFLGWLLVFAPGLAWLILSPGPGRAGEREPTAESALDVRVITDEADGVLALLALRSSGETPTEGDWTELEATEGYRRLKRRAESYGAEAFDESFRQWVLAADLDDLDRLRDGVARWRSLDATAVARRAFAYLPPGSRLHATIYPVLKKAGNSFVFELDSDPAIFMYVSGEASESELANTLAHELHHVGTAAACSDSQDDSPVGRAGEVLRWMGGFAEGLAVLAAAGGPEIHPHAGRDAEEWIVWERDMAQFNRDLGRIEAFFREILAGELDAEAQRSRFLELISTEEVPQGPFYTVGWKMAALVEQRFGRQRVIEAICDMRLLLTAYNEIATSPARSDGSSLATWSPELLRAVSAER